VTRTADVATVGYHVLVGASLAVVLPILLVVVTASVTSVTSRPTAWAACRTRSRSAVRAGMDRRRRDQAMIKQFRVTIPTVAITLALASMARSR